MGQLTLSYRGYSLTLNFSYPEKYSGVTSSDGKTIYQILFEQLIDGKPVSLKRLSDELAQKKIRITPPSIGQAMQRIQNSIANSPNKRLKNFRFKRFRSDSSKPDHPVLHLSYRGIALDVPAPNNSFATAEIVHGKTIYQILFEHLLRGRIVSAKGLARACTKRGVELSSEGVRNMMKRIEIAAANSSHPNVSAMRFNRHGRGGSLAVFNRFSSRSRFTLQQRELIHLIIMNALRQGTKSRKELTKLCISALNQAKIGQNVLLGGEALNNAIHRVEEQNPDLKGKVFNAKGGRRRQRR